MDQIINLLSKKADTRRQIIYLCLKVIFTTLISTKLYSLIYPNFQIISLTNYPALIEFFIKGNFIVCFVIFYVFWTISYQLIPSILYSLSTWRTNVFYNKIKDLFTVDQVQLIIETKEGIKKNKNIRNFFKFLDYIGVVEMENSNVRPGKEFYSIYDYLTKIEKGKRTVPLTEFSSNIVLLLQFIIIYIWLDLKFLSYSYWLMSSVIIIGLIIFILSLLLYIISVFIDRRHIIILDFLEKLDPENLTET